MLWPGRIARGGIIFPTIALWEHLRGNGNGEERGQWDTGTRGCRSSTIQRGGAAALSFSSCLKAERETKNREKEIKEGEGQKGKKTGQVFPTCLLAEQSYFWGALWCLKQKQPMTCSPWYPVALGGCCLSADGPQVLVGLDHHDSERIPEAAFTHCPNQDTLCIPAGKVMSKFQGS